MAVEREIGVQGKAEVLITGNHLELCCSYFDCDIPRFFTLCLVPKIISLVLEALSVSLVALHHAEN